MGASHHLTALLGLHRGALLSRMCRPLLLDLCLHGRPLLSLYRGALLCRLCRPLLLDLRLHGCPLLSLLGLHRALLGGSLLRGLRLHGRSLLGCLSRALLLGLKRASLLRTLLGGPLRRSLPRILHCSIPRSLNGLRCGHPRTRRGRTRSRLRPDCIGPPGRRDAWAGRDGRRDRAV